MNIKRTVLGVAFVIALAPWGAETAVPNAARAVSDKLFIEQGDYNTAIECFTDALKLAPNYTLGSVDRGRGTNT